jgi:hypothetical protein
MRDDIRDLIREHIERYGQHVVCVQRSEGDPPDFRPFVYSIGNHEHGLPELLLVGSADDVFLRLVNRLGEIQRERRRAFAHEERVSLGGNFPVRILDVGKAAHDEYAVQAGVYYGTEDFRVRQILLCDKEGRWPDDPNCGAPYSRQPILSSG